VSRTSELSIQCYLRTEKPKRGAEGDDMGNDLFMGGIKFKPDFDSRNTPNDWYTLTGGAGKIEIGVEYRPSTVRGLDVAIRDAT
jgi:serum/glucocorticoid-regulated kinase 2